MTNHFNQEAKPLIGTWIAGTGILSATPLKYPIPILHSYPFIKLSNQLCLSFLLSMFSYTTRRQRKSNKCWQHTFPLNDALLLIQGLWQCHQISYTEPCFLKDSGVSSKQLYQGLVSPALYYFNSDLAKPGLTSYLGLTKLSKIWVKDISTIIHWSIVPDGCQWCLPQLLMKSEWDFRSG